MGVQKEWSWKEKRTRQRSTYEKYTPVKGIKREPVYKRNGDGEERGQGRGLAYEKCTPVKRGKSGVGVQKEWSWE